MKEEKLSFSKKNQIPNKNNDKDWNPKYIFKEDQESSSANKQYRNLADKLKGNIVFDYD